MSGPPAPGADGHLGDRLSALLDGELAEPEAQEARHHLAACPTCSQELQAVGEARSWLRHLPAVEPPAAFRERLLGADPSLVDGAPSVVPISRRRGLAVAALAGCAAAAAAVLGLLPAPDPPAEPKVTRLVEAHATAGQGGDPLSRLVPVGVPVSFGR